MEWRMTRGGNILDPEIPIQRKLGVYKHFSASYSSKIFLAFSIKFNRILIMRLCNFNRMKLRDRCKEQDGKAIDDTFIS